MGKTYHIYKGECHLSSRIVMQSSWDDDPVYVHIDKAEICENHTDCGINTVQFNLLNILRVCFADEGHRTCIFHAQSALPYLVTIYIIKKILLCDKTTIIYDIHDLLQKNNFTSNYKRIRYNIIRYYILIILEYLCFRMSDVHKMTVSRGLAAIMGRRYGAPRPLVVYNIGSLPKKNEQLENNDERNIILYFGGLNRIPTEIIDKLYDSQLEMHLYGKEITDKWIDQNVLNKNKEFIRVCGGYSPNKLNFLMKYSILIYYQPENNSLNFRYSMPNKLFQALSAGLSIITSENFREIAQSLRNIPGAVHVLDNPDNIGRAIDHLLAMRGHGYAGQINGWITNKYNKSMEHYFSVKHKHRLYHGCGP